MLSVRLLELRKSKKMRQEDLAKSIGIARTTYAMYEQGKRQPDYETLQKLADLFKVTTDYLLGRTDEPNGNETPSSAFYDMDNLTEEEKEFLEEQLEIFRKYKKDKKNKNS